MKTTCIFVLLLMFASIFSSHAQNAASDPVGFVTINIPAGTGFAKKISMISAPLLDLASINGSVTGSLTGVTSSTLSCSSAKWTPGSLSRAATPFLIQITSGNATGHMLLISTTTNNTATTVTIDADDITGANKDIRTLGISVGDTFKIIPCDTLLSFLGTPSTTGILGGTIAASADTVVIVVNGTSRTYFYSSTLGRWTLNATGFVDSSNVPIRPNAGVQYCRLGRTPISLTVTGRVPTVGRKVPVRSPGLTYLSSFFPADVTLSSLGLENLSNWAKNPSANAADTVTIFSNGISNTYYYNGSNWIRNALGSTISNSIVIPAGSSILIQRRGTSPKTSILSQATPYSLQ